MRLRKFNLALGSHTLGNKSLSSILAIHFIVKIQLSEILNSDYLYTSIRMPSLKANAPCMYTPPNHQGTLKISGSR